MARSHTYRAVDTDEDGNQFLPAPDYRGRVQVVRDYSLSIPKLRRKLAKAQRGFEAARRLQAQQLEYLRQMQKDQRWHRRILIKLGLIPDRSGAV